MLSKCFLGASSCVKNLSHAFSDFGLTKVLEMSTILNLILQRSKLRVEKWDQYCMPSYSNSAIISMREGNDSDIDFRIIRQDYKITMINKIRMLKD